MVDVKKNITSIFMVPTLKINRELMRDNGFINGYVLDKRLDVQYEGCIYILFKPDSIENFREFLDVEYERTVQIIDDYDYEDGFVVVVYKLDKKFQKDFDLIKKGKYSKVSKEFQDLFPTVIKVKKNGLSKDEISLQYRIFNKTEDLRTYWEDKIGVVFDEDMELWSGWVEENEILDVDKIKDYV